MKILFLNWAPIIKYGMSQGFEQLGHEVSIIDPSEDNYEGMMAHIDRFKPDYLFTEGGIAREDYIIRVIHASSVPHIYWAIEDPIASNLSLTYGNNSVLVGTTCVEWIDEIYKPAGVKAISLPFACNPDWHKRGVFVPELAHNLSFMGNNYEVHGYRKVGYEAMFRPFTEDGDIVFYGNPEWVNPNFSFSVKPENYKGYLPYESLPNLCASSDFILGVHSVEESKTMQSMRTFEVLGCGGFFFTHYSLAVEEMFINHEHLVWSKSAEETTDMYKWYVIHDSHRRKIAQQGRQFVYENHTYKHRAQAIVDALREV